MATYTFRFLTSTGSALTALEVVECQSDVEALNLALARLAGRDEAQVIEVYTGEKMLVRLGERLFGRAC